MFLKVVRRTHMYLALFLTPWVLMYALSTMAMNHRASLQRLYGKEPPPFEKVRELKYDGSFPDGAQPKVIAQQILANLGMTGLHNARRSPDGSKLIINRQEPLGTRRITYTPADTKILIEKESFRATAFLERMHRRRGYQSGYRNETIWAFSVDLVIAAMLFWAASGLWMWWELKSTRRLGALVALGALTLFFVFLFTL